MDRDRELAAAPPDAGGHLGSFSVPTDTLQTRRDDRPYPALHRIDHHRMRRRPEGNRHDLLGWGLAAFFLLAVAALTALSFV